MEINNPLKGKTDYGWHFEQNVYSLDSCLIRSLKSDAGSGNIPKVILDEKTKCNKTRELKRKLPRIQGI